MRILIAPLYPQYSAATTATVNDEAFRALMKMRWQPALRTLPDYHNDPAYIDALAVSLEKGLRALSFEPELVLASYHGLPQSYVDKGDPYYAQAVETTRLLRQRLGWSEDRLRLTFQSRFGRAEWLKPYTAETIEKLAKSGVKRIAVVMPGFAADCIETLEEIAMQNAEIFRAHGGSGLRRHPLPQRQRRGHGPHRDAGPAGAGGVDLAASSSDLAFTTRNIIPMSVLRGRWPIGGERA